MATFVRHDSTASPRRAEPTVRMEDRVQYTTMLGRKAGSNGVDAPRSSLGLKPPSKSLSRVVEHVSDA